MELRPVESNDLTTILRIGRTMEFPEGPDTLEAFTVNGDEAYILLDDDRPVGFIGMVDAIYRTIRLGLRPDYRSEDTVCLLVNEVDGEKIDLYYEEKWLHDLLKQCGFQVVDEFGLSYADGGYTLIRE